MNRTPLRALVAFAVIASTMAAGSATKPVDPGSAAAEHQRIVDFWTNERVSQAIPRDFVKTGPGRYAPVAKPDKPGKPGGGGSGGGGTITGASWNGAGAVADTTGKVLFAMGGSYYVCSASLVTDNKSDRSIVLTAAHCIYDEAGEAFATNWMFIPNYDAAPASLTTSGSFCDSTKWGCWSATGLVAHNGYTSAGSFNDQAVVYDFGFAVLGSGGKSGGQADATIGKTQTIAYDVNDGGVNVYAFGYPAAKKYKGNDLVYCAGPTGFDPLMGDQTYKIACDMTGGSSGGPWMRDFSTSTGSGVLTSVNSYGYSGDNSMHGPKFNSNTRAAFDLAVTVGSGIVP
ncbi:MAG: hypothetical protein OEY55_10855 [Acidimicrobiia bacterium]|nr:hypothetical protein [Acidimicrobiia bacterium]MDH5422290.1 hypothetical protein [Acidimicrobiia bacterium]MDH5503955.1 hypothetical protein [Acidimicrobiia bacterium]